MANRPDLFPQTQTRRGTGGVRADIGIYVRSGWEANYARYLNFLKTAGDIIDWKFEPKTFEFEGIKRGSRFYTPDFLVTWKNGRSEYHEVKGYMDQRSATKLKRMKKYHPEVVVVLIDSKHYRGIAKSMRGLIPHWEGRIQND